MTKTPTLRVSADMLVSQGRALPPGPPVWVTEREVPSRLCPALTLVKPREEEEEEEERSLINSSIHSILPLRRTRE